MSIENYYYLTFVEFTSSHSIAYLAGRVLNLINLFLLQFRDYFILYDAMGQTEIDL
jgi:hypothetical protein